MSTASTEAEKFIEVDGRKLTIRKIGPEAIPDVKAKILSTRKNAFAAGLDQATLSQFDDDTKALIIREALKQASMPTVSMGDVDAFLRSVDGASFGLWLALRHNGPDITPEYVLTLIARPEVKSALEAAG